MPIQVEDRDIYVSTGAKSQTVKICDCRNVRGEYERYFRIFPVNPQYGQHQMVAELERRAENDRTLDEVIEWLREDLGAVDELSPGIATAADGSDDEPPPLSPPGGADVPPQPWFSQAISAVDGAVDALVDEFAKFPYMHRVEHCLHTRLVELLRQKKTLCGTHQIGYTGEWTQLVHKEWPETIPRPGKSGRGNFDVVVLSPTAVAACAGPRLLP